MMSRLLPQNWNDVMALLGLVIIPTLWWLGGLPEGVEGALIVTWTLVWNYYFRKAPTEKH